MDEQERSGESNEPERGPVGTIFVLIIFLMMLAGMWGAVYFTLLGR